eukprot:gene20777-1125_t
MSQFATEWPDISKSLTKQEELPKESTFNKYHPPEVRIEKHDPVACCPNCVEIQCCVSTKNRMRALANCSCPKLKYEDLADLVMCKKVNRAWKASATAAGAKLQKKEKKPQPKVFGELVEYDASTYLPYARLNGMCVLELRMERFFRIPSEEDVSDELGERLDLYDALKAQLNLALNTGEQESDGIWTDVLQKTVGILRGKLARAKGVSTREVKNLVRVKGKVVCESHDLLSPCKKHDSSYAVHGLDTICKYLKDKAIKRLHVWSDGAAHFRNRWVMKAISETYQKYGFTSSYHCWESHHGKWMYDGEGGRLKRFIRSAVRAGKGSTKIHSAMDAFNFLSENHQKIHRQAE